MVNEVRAEFEGQIVEVVVAGKVTVGNVVSEHRWTIPISSGLTGGDLAGEIKAAVVEETKSAALGGALDGVSGKPLRRVK